MEPEEGFEPTTYCLQNSCSAPELLRHQYSQCAGRGIRTPVGTSPSDLQSDAFDRSAIPAFIHKHTITHIKIFQYICLISYIISYYLWKNKLYTFDYILLIKYNESRCYTNFNTVIMTLNIFKIIIKRKKKKRRFKNRVDPIANFVSMPTRERKKFAKKVVYKAQHPRHKSKIEQQKKKMKKLVKK